MRSRIARNLEWLFAPQTPAVSSMPTFARNAAAKEKAEPPTGLSGHDYAVFLLHIAAETC